MSKIYKSADQLIRKHTTGGINKDRKGIGIRG